MELRDIVMLLRLLALPLLAVMSPAIPGTPIPFLIAAVVVLLVCVPLAGWAINSFRTLLSAPPNAPPHASVFRRRSIRRLPGAPGTRGAAHPRAPSFVVPASA